MVTLLAETRNLRIAVPDQSASGWSSAPRGQCGGSPEVFDSQGDAKPSRFSSATVRWSRDATGCRAFMCPSVPRGISPDLCPAMMRY